MSGALAFWSFALADLLGVVVCAWLGVRRIRAADVRGHRRLMLAAASLVGLFLASYGVKLALMGREDLSTWDTASLVSLYVHETFIAIMLVAGGLAGLRAWRFGRAALAEGPAPPGSRGRDRRFHRRAGGIAVWASVFAWIAASLMLAGMYARA